MSRSSSSGLPTGKVASHLGVMLLVSVVLGVVVAGLAIPFAGVVGFSARNVAKSVEELPQELETALLPQRTELKDKKGRTFATLYDQNRVNVPLTQISRKMVEAIVAIEDYRFYQHGALDVKGTLRAFLTNQASGGVTQGGSSLTQQLVKQTLITQANGDEKAIERAKDDSYARKIRELRYAIALEKRHSKDWILERYLNTVYFGDGAYGVQAAAQHYFSTNAKDLNVRQSALLAGLVQSPEAYNPRKNAAQAKVRRNVVLARMAQLNVITDKQADNISGKRLGLKVQDSPNGCLNTNAQFFCDYVVRWLMEDPALGKTRDDRKALIFNGGLTIKTTLDVGFQKAAQDGVSSQVYKGDSAVGAIALVEPGTGNVRGLAQSKPMGTKKGQGETFLNYTVPKKYGDANGVQAGSTFKAFTLASAIEKGVPLTKTFPGRPVPVRLGDFERCDGPYQSAETWNPANSTDAGASPNLYDGTRSSVNSVFVALEKEIGICGPWKMARSMGITSLKKTDQTPAFTLGVPDVSPLDMAQAYATFAARGVHCDPRPVMQIEDSNKNVLKKYGKSCRQVMSSPVADAVNDVLRGVVEPGGFGSGLNPGQPAAGKTGTTNGNLSVWFAGYTPNLAAASTVFGLAPNGNQATLDGKSIGGYVRGSTSGSTTAGPIWGNTFKAIAQWLPDDDFVQPSGTDINGLLVEIPPVGGKSYDDAKSQLEGLGFKVADGGMVDSGYARGLIAYSYPGAGDRRASGDTITLYTSDGSPKVVKKPKKNKKKNRGGNGGGRGNRGRGGGGDD